MFITILLIQNFTTYKYKCSLLIFLKSILNNCQALRHKVGGAYHEADLVNIKFHSEIRFFKSKRYYVLGPRIHMISLVQICRTGASKGSLATQNASRKSSAGDEIYLFVSRENKMMFMSKRL